MKLQKDTIGSWAFIANRVFILSSIASETGHSLEMVQSVQLKAVIEVSCHWEQDIQSKDIDKTRKVLYTWMKLPKETLCLQAFIVKRVFILNSIAFKTGHSLEVDVSAKKAVIEVFCHFLSEIIYNYSCASSNAIGGTVVSNNQTDSAPNGIGVGTGGNLYIFWHSPCSLSWPDRYRLRPYKINYLFIIFARPNFSPPSG